MVQRLLCAMAVLWLYMDLSGLATSLDRVYTTRVHAVLDVVASVVASARNGYVVRQASRLLCS
jgi:hypothetical protein